MQNDPEPYTLNPRREPVISVDVETWGPWIHLGIGDRNFGLDPDEAEGLAEALIARVAYLRQWQAEYATPPRLKLSA